MSAARVSATLCQCAPDCTWRFTSKGVPRASPPYDAGRVSRWRSITSAARSRTRLRVPAFRPCSWQFAPVGLGCFGAVPAWAARTRASTPRRCRGRSTAPVGAAITDAECARQDPR
jgi:hypothetical protein